MSDDMKALYDMVTIDYRVRGFTRDINGMKHFYRPWD